MQQGVAGDRGGLGVYADPIAKIVIFKGFAVDLEQISNRPGRQSGGGAGKPMQFAHSVHHFAVAFEVLLLNGWM